MTIVCCLCGKSLEDRTSQKKSGQSFTLNPCANTRRVLERLLTLLNATLNSYVETHSPDVYLCYTCDGIADSLQYVKRKPMCKH